MKPPRALLIVAEKLGPLLDRVVFVGGMIRGLLSTDPAAGAPRPTDDVDLIVDVRSLAEYHEFAASLRARGFREDTREGAPICRWVVGDVTTDVMPIDPAVFGFSNVWYESAQRHASTTNTDAGPLRHLDAPHFCATKLEAFAGRGGGDYYHHDLEDFVAIVDERSELADEIADAPSDVREFLATSTQSLLATPEFVEALRGHLSGDEVGEQRLPGLRAKLQRTAALGGSSSDRPAAPAHAPRGTSVRVDPRAANRPRKQPRRISPPPSPAGAIVVGFGRLPSVRPVESPTGRVYVQSSNLSWVEYDSLNAHLTVGFTQGGTYRYSGVPAAVYQGLVGAYSKGRYLSVWIKDRYSARKLR